MTRPRPPLPRPLLCLGFLVLTLAVSPGLRAGHEPAPAGAAAHPPEKTHGASSPAPESPTPAQSPPHAESPAAHAPAEAPAHPAPAHPAPSHAAEPKHADHVSAPETTPALGEDEIRGMLNLGGNMTDRGDYDAAEIAFRQIMKSPGVPVNDTKSALLGLARMHRKKGELTKAAAIYEKFLKEFPGDDRTPDALLDLGRTLRALGVYEMAISRFYNVINSTLKLPADGFEHYQLLAKTAQFEIAETHFQAGRFEEAGKFFARLRLLDLAPADRARAHFKAAYAQHLQGDHEASVSTLRTFIEQSPDDENVPEGRYLLAVGLRALNRRQEAFLATIELLRTEKSRVATDPKRWAYWQRRTGNQLANDFYENGDTLNAHAIYAGLVDLSTEPIWRLPILYQIALCHERLGNVERARATYQNIVEVAGPAPTADTAELAHMASWRLSHLAWQEQTGRQISAIFENTTGRSPTPALPPATKTSAIP